MKIEPEDFAAWRDNPITEIVFRYLKKQAAACKDEWLAASWGAGNSDPLLLADLRAKEQMLTDLSELKYEDIADEE